MASIYDSTKFVIDKRTIEIKEKEIIELNNKTTIIINNPQMDNISAISFNKKIDAVTTSDKKYDDVHDTSFIDKMISETTEPEVIAQLKKVKESRVFYL